MYVLKRRILIHAIENNELPLSLDDLKELEGFNNSTNDYWGNQVQYLLDGSTVTLRSNGKDKEPGGAGENLDIMGIFDAKNINGEWANSNNDVEWKYRPLRGYETKENKPHNKANAVDAKKQRG